MSLSVKVNGKKHSIDVDDDTPLLWLLRDVLGMTGTEFGCGRALCGACTVHVDGVATRSCVTSDASVKSSEHCTTSTSSHAFCTRAPRSVAPIAKLAVMSRPRGDGRPTECTGGNGVWISRRFGVDLGWAAMLAALLMSADVLQGTEPVAQKLEKARDVPWLRGDWNGRRLRLGDRGLICSSVTPESSP